MRTQLVAGIVAALALGGLGSQPSFAKSVTPAIDPDAIDALHKMGGFLREQQKFTVHANATTDDLLSSGQKVQFSGTVEMMVRRPDRLRVDIRGDRHDERLYYDGKTFTVYGQRVGYFASFAAPPTLAELKTETEKRGIDLPLADLFYWGTANDGTKEITAATKVGVSTIEGTACDHYAFRQKDVDWEIWIQQGPQALPRKLVITTTGDKSRPQHSAIMTWDLAPQLSGELFTFEPPPEAHQIDFENVTAARGRR